MEIPDQLADIQNSVRTIKNDSLVKTLTENSHFTEKQLETLLIDFLAEDPTRIRMNFNLKAKIRTSDHELTRGSFNRTLKQAKRNMTNSICTVLLLGYLGILGTPALDPFLEASNKLQEYMKTHKDLWEETKKGSIDKKSLESASSMRNELLSSLSQHSKAKLIKHGM